MARTPRATVSQTSGQGISRLSYQKGRALAKSPAAPQVKMASSQLTKPASNKSYGKIDMGSPLGGSMNVSYGDTFDPTDIKDITLADPKRGPKNPPRGPSIMGSPKRKAFPK